MKAASPKQVMSHAGGSGVAGIAVIPIAFDVPVIELLPVSVAVIVWLPVVLRVAENVRTPLVSVESAGSVALGSLAVKWTVPE